LALTNSISRWIFKAWGWKVTGPYPHEIPKLVLAVAPHTSNWDFPVGVLVRSACDADKVAVFVAKHTLFKPPFGWLFRWMNGVPVDRNKKGGNFVAAVVEEFHKREKFHLCVAPEGTRKKVDRFKTGFYHIAKGAGVPIVLTRFDWGTREVDFGERFYPTDNEEKDLQYIWNYFKNTKGHNPENGIS
jgi:1-acyl-sn-glycerol-3-phosphate acyltransferase